MVVGHRGEPNELAHLFTRGEAECLLGGAERGEFAGLLT